MALLTPCAVRYGSAAPVRSAAHLTALAMAGSFATVLTALTLAVHWIFVPAVVVPYFAGGAPAGNLLAARGEPVPPAVAAADLARLPPGDRTGGRDLAPLFEALPTVTRGADLLVAFIGDSTVGGTDPDHDLPRLVQLELAARLPHRRVQMLDLSVLGLFANDALFVAAKAFAVEPDLVVYALNPRVAPVDQRAQWGTTAFSHALEPPVVRRIGLRRIVELLDVDELARAAVYSWWAPARLRLAGAWAVRAMLPPWCPRSVRVAVDQLLARPAGATPPPAPPRPGVFAWVADDYVLDPPTRASRSLETLMELCAREGRCLLYLGPVNPAGNERFPPVIATRFAAWAREHATRAGVPLIDHREAQPAEHFRPGFVGPDPLHLTEAGWRAFAPVLAGDVARRLEDLGR